MTLRHLLIAATLVMIPKWTISATTKDNSLRRVQAITEISRFFGFESATTPREGVRFRGRNCELKFSNGSVTERNVFLCLGNFCFTLYPRDLGSIRVGNDFEGTQLIAFEKSKEGALRAQVRHMRRAAEAAPLEVSTESLSIERKSAKSLEVSISAQEGSSGSSCLVYL